jgi:hypothetical protein
MTVVGGEIAVVLNDHQISVSEMAVGVNHHSRSHGANLSATWGRKINPIVMSRIA